MARPTRNQTPEDRVVAKRPNKKRVPLGTGKNVLTADSRPGYRRRFINAVGDRIKNALAAGYTVVEDRDMQVGDSDAVSRNSSMGSGVEVTVDRDGTKAILMELPEEYGREDDERKAGMIDENEEVIKSKHKQEGYYGKVKTSIGTI